MSCLLFLLILYFYCISPSAFFQQIPGLSPTGRWGTTVPLALSLIVSAGKEIFEDFSRSKEDESINSRKVLLANSEGKSIELQSLKVGHVVRILRDELIPADLVLLKSSETDGLCFLETAAIDGESNLKLRQALTQTHLMDNWNDSSITCDPPNNEIFDFYGSLILSTSASTSNKSFSIDRNQFLPRGSFLVNTDWIVGVIVYTGIETKIMQNVNGNSRRKITKMDKLNDTQNAQIVGILFVLVFALLFGNIYYNLFVLKDHKYLEGGENGKDKSFLWSSFTNFITFLLLLNNLVPISLSVTLEIVRAILSHLINNDLDMYDEELQISSKALSSNVLDELGRIEYIMTDKTGTLTCNRMKLKSLFVNDKIYKKLDENLIINLKRENSLESKLLEMIALCHTVMIDKNNSFKASSPDELALLEAATRLETRFVSRSSDEIEIEIFGIRKRFSIKAVIEFTSERKRMSIVLHEEETGKFIIITKGADSVIFPICSNSTEKAHEAVEEFSLNGLRTLCLAYREFDSIESFKEWHNKWNEALNTFGPTRQSKIDLASISLESSLNLVGVTGIEDRLQPGVPRTISTLLKANIKIWILTGDRAETATNTAYLSGLLKPHHSILNISNQKELFDALNLDHPIGDYFTIISGEMFASVLADKALKLSFVKFAQNSRALVAYRLSPLQKSEITVFVQNYLHKTTLAIGDGGNDVGMIQAADVGIGINGLEGTQAARSADFSLPKFCFLSKLLLVHGAWSFHRISRVILYMMYKNFLLVLIQFWYAWFNSFSAQSAFSWLFLMFYNALFTFAPPIIIGLTDQYVTAPELLKHPQLYQFGQKGKFYNQKAFWECILNASIQSLMVCACFYFLIHSDPIISTSSLPTNLHISGDILFFIVILIDSIKVLLFTNFFTKIMSVALWSSIIFCFLLLWSRSPSKFLLSPTFLTAGILIPIFTLLRDFLWKFYKRQFKPRAYHIVQEMRAVEMKRSKDKLKQSISISSSISSESTPLYK